MSAWALPARRARLSGCCWRSTRRASRSPPAAPAAPRHAAEPSYVLQALGFDPFRARGALRLTLGRFNTQRKSTVPRGSAADSSAGLRRIATARADLRLCKGRSPCCHPQVGPARRQLRRLRLSHLRRAGGGARQEAGPDRPLHHAAIGQRRRGRPSARRRPRDAYHTDNLDHRQARQIDLARHARARVRFLSRTFSGGPGPAGNHPAAQSHADAGDGDQPSAT